MTHVTADLLAYLDGELSPTETRAVEAHLAHCPSCAAALAELTALQAGLDRVVPVAFETIHLPPDAEARIRDALAKERARRERSGTVLQGLSDLLAGLASVLQPLSKAAIPLVAMFFIALTANIARLPVQFGVQQTVLLGNNSFTPGTDAGVRVLVRDQASNQPIANANVAVKLRQAGLARTVYAGSTDATGSAPIRFTVPPDWRGDVELVVEAASDLGKNELVQPIRLERSYRLLLSSDKPIYQPDETIHLRALALGRVDGLPAGASTVHFEVMDPQGDVLLSQPVPTSEFGIAATDLPLASDTIPGQYQLRATLDDTSSELSVKVERIPLPSFRVDVKADAPYYLAGDLVSGQVNAAYFFGKPVAGADVDLRLLGTRLGQDPTQGEERLFVREVIGEMDANGTFRFQFSLPELPANAFDQADQPAGNAEAILELALEATVTDSSGKSEFGWQQVNMARQPILIDVVAEGGTLRSGVENVLYVLTSYPDGQPAAASLALRIGSGETIEETTSEFGLAEVRYTPRTGAGEDRRITVTATDAASHVGTTVVDLPLDEARETLLLRTDSALYQVGDTLGVEILATGDNSAVYLDVLKGGQVLMTRSAVLEAGRATLGIDLTSDLAGTLELSGYQVTTDNNVLRDDRVVLVSAPENLQVQLATDQEEYRPGELAQLEVETQLGDQGEQTAVGLSVVNEAVYAQREYQPGFARVYFILDKALQDAGVSLPTSPPSSAVDTQTQQALRTAQQQTAKASWVSYEGQNFTLAAQTTDLASQDTANQERQVAFQRLSLALSLALAVFSLLLIGIVIAGLRKTGSLGKAAWRLLVTLVVLVAIGSLLLIATQVLMGTLSRQIAGQSAESWLPISLAVMALLWLVGVAALLVYGWRRHDQRAQYVALLLLASVVCLALLGFVTAQAAVLSSAWLSFLGLSLGLLVAGVVLYGWGLRQEGAASAGLMTVSLGVLTMLLLTAAVWFSAADSSSMLRATQPPAVLPLPGLQNRADRLAAQPRSRPTQVPAPAEVGAEIEVEVEATAPVEKIEERTAGTAEEPAMEPEAAMEAPAAEPEAAMEAPAPESEAAMEAPAPEPEAAMEAPAPEPEPAMEAPAAEPEPAMEAPAAEPEPAMEAPATEPEAAMEALASAEEATPEALERQLMQVETPAEIAAPAQEQVLTPTPEVAALSAGAVPEEVTTTPAPEPTETSEITRALAIQPEASVSLTTTLASTEALGFEVDILTARPGLTTTITRTRTAGDTALTARTQLTDTFLPEPAPGDIPSPEVAALAAQAGPTESVTATATPRPSPTPTPVPTATPQPAETGPAAPESLPQPTPAPLPTLEPLAEPFAPAAAPPSEARGIGGGGGEEGEGPPPARPAPAPVESLPIIRERFPQTLYWNPEAVTDDEGHLQLSFPTGDAITTWRINAVAVTRQGQLGSASTPLVVFQSLFLITGAPEDMVLGDKAVVQAQIFNYSAVPHTVTLVAVPSPGLEVEIADLPITVPANEVVILPVVITAREAGAQTLRLSVLGDHAQDAQQIDIFVWPSSQ